MTDDKIDIDDDTKTRIRERVLKAEKDQLHLDRPHNIIPEVTEIIESEVDEVDEIPIDTDGGS